MNPIKANPMRPVMMNEIPNPRKGAGTLEYLNFSRIAAIEMIAMHIQPLNLHHKLWLLQY